ncbi:MAG: hypothetical protein JWM13_2785 [Arthrobacter sp.]|nr:hypothetical protein [Arthrobacter sp.]
MFRRSRTGGAQKAYGVGVIHHDQGVVLFGELADRFQRRQETVHGEDAVRDDDLPAGRILLGRGLDQLGLEVRHVLVGVAEALGLAEPDAVDDRGVVQGVGDHGVLRAEEGLENAAVGVKATGEQDGVLRAEELRDTFLQGQVQVLGAADEAHAGHAEAPLVHRCLGGGDDLRVVREAQVVVGAEVQDVGAGIADLSGLDPVGLRGINVPLGLKQAGAADLVQFMLQLVLDG